MTQKDQQDQGQQDRSLFTPIISTQQGLQGEEAATFLAEVSQAVDSTEPGSEERLQKVGAVVARWSK